MVDTEVLYSPGFILLTVGSVGAIIMGYVMSKNWDVPVFPLWQLLIIILGAIVASYYFASRG